MPQVKHVLYKVAIQFRNDDKLYETWQAYEPTIKDGCLFVIQVGGKLLIVPLDVILQVQVLPITQKDAQS